MRTQLLILAGALLLVLAACGGDTADTTAPTLPTMADETAETPANLAEGEATTTTEAVDPDEAFQEYTQCMREHGIEMPDGDGGIVSVEVEGEDLDFSAFEDAASECDPILEAAFGEFELDPEQQAEMADHELAFARCMRDNGIDWPDPDPSGSNMIELPADVDPETVNAAVGTCSEEAFGEGGLIIGGETP